MRQSLARIAALVRKELLAILLDPRARLILVAPPLLQLLIFAFASTQEVRHVRLGVLDQDHGAAAFEITERFVAAAPTFERPAIQLASLVAVRAALDAGQVGAVLQFPTGFSRDVAAGRPAQLQLLLDGRRANADQAIEAYASAIVEGYGLERASALSLATPDSEMTIRVWFNPNGDSLIATLPSLLSILLAITALILTALSVARERELGTFEQLLVSPLTPLEILVGKALPPIGLAFCIATVMALVSVELLGLPLRGPGWMLPIAALLYLLALVGVGLLVSAICTTQQQAILGAFMVLVPAVLLAGYATPVENVPGWLRWLSDIDPVRYMIDLVRLVFLTDTSAWAVLPKLLPLAGASLVTLPLAAWLFRRRVV